jgi:UDPglucose 6-dehydrogenase
MKFKKNILCIGAGYVGGPTMAVIAAKCPHLKVTVVDINKKRIAAWKSNELPVYEPGLLEVLKTARNRNLFFSTNIGRHIADADIIFVAVHTPIKTFGLGAGMAADLQYWEKTAHQIIHYSKSDKIIVEKSTLPVRTAEAMERILRANKKNIHFEVVSNPEFLAEGTAISDLTNPDRILIGSRETRKGTKARKEIVEIFSNWVSGDRIIQSNVWSAELSKLIANAFLAQRISSINSVSALCESTEADVEEVAYAIGKDSRIGPKFLNASVGFGGSCFKKDILNLVYISRSYALNEVADYWESVVNINQWQERRFVQAMLKNMFNTVAGKNIAIFGFAFKANTGDTRESPAILISRELIEERANLIISDPKALENARLNLQEQEQHIRFESDPYKAARGVHAVALLTEWEMYRGLDYERIYRNMHRPAFIFDGRNILDHRKLYKIGFNVFPIGKAPLKHY